MSEFLPWKIEHVALRKPLPELSSEPGCGGLFVVFWCDDVPVGHCFMIPAPLLPITPAQLATMVSPLTVTTVGDRMIREQFSESLAASYDPRVASV